MRTTHGGTGALCSLSRARAVAMTLCVLVSVSMFLAAGCGGPSVTFRDGNTKATLTVEVARTPAAVERGLQGRKSLPEGEGMLFDFGGYTRTPFWMKDIPFPLSIAFMDAKGNVLGVKDMKPLDETLVEPPGEYYYAVETNQGWFAENGVRAGSKADIKE